MSLNITGQSALITGSTDGLGKQIAINLAKLNVNLYIHGRNQKKINQTVKELQSLNHNIKINSVQCDLNKLSLIPSSFNHISNLDILINNAGVWLEGGTVDATPSKITELLNVNLGAPLLVTHTVLPKLTKSKFAQILNVVSIAGVEIPAGYYHTFYSATKFGLQAFSEGLAKEYDNQNIRIMGYYPGGMETDLFTKAGLDYQKHEPWMFKPVESAEAIIFMLTRNSKINIKRMDLINHLQI